MEISKELSEKAKTAKSAEELLQMAKAENIEMTAEEANKVYAELHKTGELSDEEPLINCRWEKTEREIDINITGQIQLEVIAALLKERYERFRKY